MAKSSKKPNSIKKLLKKYSGWIAALVVVMALGYYINNGIYFSSAFEQLPRSLAYYVAEQSGLPNYDGEMDIGTHYAKPGDVVDMWVTVKNMSKNPKALTWYPESSIIDEGPEYPFAHAIGVGTANPIDTKPNWIEPSSFVINNNRLVYYEGPPVNRNGYVTFAWKVRISPYALPGTYTLDLDLVREFDEHGIRVNSAGRMLINQFMRWNFKISELNVYDIPINISADPNSVVVVAQRAPGQTNTQVITFDPLDYSYREIFKTYDPEKVSVADAYKGRFLVSSANPYISSARILDENGYLYMDLDGITPGYPIVEALISPNERYIALNTTNFPGEFYIYDTDTGELTSHVPIFNPWLTNGGNYRYYDYWWSSDSSKLYARWSNSNSSGFQVDKDSGIDQLTMPLTSGLQPIPVITDLNLKDVVFDVLSGTAIGSSYGLEDGSMVPPSDMALIYPNTGIVDNIAHSEVTSYKAKSISQDGSVFAYETINDVGSGNTQNMLWVSRSNDIYQAKLIQSYPIDDMHDGNVVSVEALGFSPNNQLFFYIEQIDVPETGGHLDGFYDHYMLKWVDLMNNYDRYFSIPIPVGMLPPMLIPLGVY
ncbi:MAG: hypothetical protein U9M89_00535 [Patescibacteria group bacterium]|nr:hypothetical protein [Patescibacteria group bacterium]